MMMMLKRMFDQLVAKVNSIEGKIRGTNGLTDKPQYDTGNQNIKRFEILLRKN